MVELKDVTFHYDEAREHGVSGLSLQIHRGECVLLCGESGCGKTTVTRLINGLIPHFYEGELSGCVRVRGKDTCATKPDDLACDVGSVFQNPRSQFFNLDTTSEIAFGCENIGLPPAEIRQRVYGTVKALGMERLLDQDIFALSGGEKQLVAMASAYAIGPEVFVLDEPSSNLDTAATRELGKLLAQLKSAGKTIIVAEHRLYYLMDIVDRVIHMRDGRIATEWTARDFLALPQSERVTLGLRSPSLRGLAPSALQVENSHATGLNISGLTAGYRRGQYVLRGVSFVASPGEVIGLIGGNGQGKSTLARVLCGLHKESAGRVALNGKPVPAARRAGLFYLIMQDTNHQLFTESVEHELRLSANRKSRPSDDTIESIMESLSLARYKDRHPMSLSGGQKQRCAIGVSLAQDARVLIFDEPTSGLDYENMCRVCEVIRDLRRQGKIILIITHDYELLLMACTRVVALRDGMIAQDVPLNETTIGEIEPFFI